MLFNLQRVLAESLPETVVIVEGFWSVLRLHAAGVPVMSCFGASLSEAQADLLADAGVKNCILFCDCDDGGRAGVEQALPILAKRFFVRSIVLEEGFKGIKSLPLRSLAANRTAVAAEIISRRPISRALWPSA